MVNNILKLVPTMQSIALLEHNINKKKKKKLVRMGVDNIIGATMIKETGEFLS